MALVSTNNSPFQPISIERVPRYPAYMVLLLRPISGNMDVDTLASKRSELIGNVEIVRMRRVIHNNSTCVCSRCRDYAETQERKLRPMAGFTCIGPIIMCLAAYPAEKCGFIGSAGLVC